MTEENEEPVYSHRNEGNHFDTNHNSQHGLNYNINMNHAVKQVYVSHPKLVKELSYHALRNIPNAKFELDKIFSNTQKNVSLQINRPDNDVKLRVML